MTKKNSWSFVTRKLPRLRGRIQLSTDGFSAYPGAVEDAFGSEVDYGWLIKTLGAPWNELRRGIAQPR